MVVLGHNYSFILACLLFGLAWFRTSGSILLLSLAWSLYFSSTTLKLH